MSGSARKPLTQRPDLVLDEVTAFVFDHHRELLTEGERGLSLVRVGRCKTVAHGEASAVFREDVWRKEHPELAALVDRTGVAEAMRRTAARVVEEHRVVLPRCGQCGALLRTPRARQCVACGFDWHA